MGNEKPTTIVIFGASGDLTQRKLLPALFQLSKQGLLPDDVHILGFARREKSDDAFREEMAEALVKFSRSQPKRDSKEVQEFVKRLYYHPGDYDDKSSFANLRERLQSLDEAAGEDSKGGNRLYYLSTPPSVFSKIVAQLGETGHIADPHDEDRWTRVIIEKPFGHDLKSARKLNREILAVLDESQVYRIDHYLGKETVQNIMAFRFGNSIFEPLWNRRYVDHVQITVSESVSVGKRAGYYDQSGALRDMVQNHMLQLLALIAIEPPASFAPQAVHNEKVKVLSALRPIEADDVEKCTVRGQYTAGKVNEETIPSYLEEPDVSDNSKTETFVSLRVHVDNWRWAGVPFYLRTGKALHERLTEIAIEFRQPPLALFGHAPHEDHDEGDRMQANRLFLRVQPDEGIRLLFGLKVPGPQMILQPTDMEFCYSDVFDTEPPEAYERLLVDALSGDNTLFIRHDEVDAAWRFIDGVLQGWSSRHDGKVHPYRAGTWGPKASDDFMARDEKKWINY